MINKPDDTSNIENFSDSETTPDDTAKGEGRFMEQPPTIRAGIAGFADEYEARYKYLKKDRVWFWQIIAIGLLITIAVSLFFYHFAYKWIFPELQSSDINIQFMYISKLAFIGFLIALLSWSLRNLGRVRRLLAVYKDRQIIARTFDKIYQSGDQQLIDKATEYVFKEIFSCGPSQALDKNSNTKSVPTLDDVIKLITTYQKH